MRTSIFQLTVSGVLRRRGESLLTLAALAISFAAGVVSLSLLGSISQTNAEYRYNTYGEWYGAVITGAKEDAEWLSERNWIDEVAAVVHYGTAIAGGKIYGFGAVDEAYRRIGRVYLDEGRWPQAENEAAVEAELLENLGCKPVCGQEITLELFGNTDEDTDRNKTGKIDMISGGNYTFTVVGIIHNYSSIWNIRNTQGNRNNLPAVSLAVTEAAGENIVNQTANSWTADYDIFPIHQFYFTITAESLDIQKMIEIKEYIGTRRPLWGDAQPVYNSAAYPELLGGGAAEDIYQFIILAVTVFAVLCIYIIRLPRQVQAYAVFRSIGASRWQLAGLIICEMLILCVPAAVLGCGAGALATWSSLKFIVFGGADVKIQVEIPWEELLRMTLWWFGTAVLARLAVFFTAVSVPLTGRFRLRGRKSLLSKRLRGGLVLLLGAVAAYVSLYSLLRGTNCYNAAETWREYPDFRVSARESTGLISENEVRLFQSIPGIAEADGYNDLPVQVSFPGLEDTNVKLWAVDGESWTKLLPFKSKADKEAFCRGDYVFVILPEDSGSVPGGEVNICVHSGENGTGSLLLDFSAAARSISLANVGGANNRGKPIEAYDLFCSHAFAANALSTMESGGRWGNLRSGQPYGFDNVFIEASDQAKDLSTDFVLGNLVREMGYGLWDDHLEFQAYVQGYMHSLLLAAAVGICVVLVALMIMVSVLSLEAQEDRRHFTLLRTLGMSQRSMKKIVIKKAVSRSAAAVAAGWGGYLFYSVYLSLTGIIPLVYEEYGRAWYILYELRGAFDPFGPVRCVGLFLSMAAVLFLTFTLSKRNFLKGGMNNVGDIAGAGIM